MLVEKGVSKVLSLMESCEAGSFGLLGSDLND